MNNSEIQIKNLSNAQKDELMKRILKKRSESKKVDFHIGKKPDNARPVSSVSQEGIFFDCQLEPESPRYNGTGYLDINGYLHTDILIKVLEYIALRHDSLRSRFYVLNGKVYIEIEDNNRVQLNSFDISNKPDINKKDLFRKKLEEENITPFDLDSSSLYRYVLVKFTESSYKLIITMHHIISDEWSLNILLEELAYFYGAIKTGNTPKNIELPVQYSDFTHWQRTSLLPHKEKINHDYWDETLSGEIPGIHLPYLKPKPGAFKYPGKLSEIEISKDCVSKLKQMAKENNTTVFTVFLAAYNILMNHYTKLEDIIISCPILDRRWTETEKIIGYFLNMLFFRTQFFSDQTFVELLEKTKTTVLEALKHRDISPHALYSILRTNGNYNNDIVGNVAFNYVNISDKISFEVEGVKFENLNMFFNTAVYNLSLMLIEKGDSVSGWIRYNTNLFSEGFVVNFIQYFHRILDLIANNPGIKLNNLSSQLSMDKMIIPVEDVKIIEEVNKTAVSFECPKCIHKIIEEQVLKMPLQIIASHGTKKTKFSELNQKANQLAHYILKHHKETQKPIAVLLGRSIDQVIVVLGILKSGNHFVAINPDFPPERIRFILTNTGTKMVITEEKYRNNISKKEGLQIINYGNNLHVIEKEPVFEPSVESSLDDVAYITYTSGTTGLPKGVVIQHKSLFNYCSWIQKEYPIDSSEAILYKTPESFDVFIREIFWPLFTGAQMVIVPEKEHMNPDYLIDKIREYKVSFISLVPGMIKVFVEKDGLSKCPSLKYLVNSGEAMPEKLKLEVLSNSDIELLNFYGPAEFTITSTTYSTRNGSNHVFPIGKPIANATTYILDKNLNQVPVGVPGELCIGGLGLALRYHDSPELTKEKFIYWSEKDKIIYKTGDHARFLADGNIEFMGRIDSQIKIRGMRIELGEIEHTINKCPDIEKAIVITDKSINGNNTLICYYIPKSDIEGQQIRDYAKGQLPDYMVPTFFTPLTEFPLSINGKVDVKQLPKPSPVIDANEKRSLVLPTNDIEKQLVEIWQETLQIDKVGVTDNFFDLGGHSLMLYKILDEIKLRININIKIIDLFEYPTIKSFIEHISNKETDKIPIPSNINKRRERLLQHQIKNQNK